MALVEFPDRSPDQATGKTESNPKEIDRGGNVVSSSGTRLRLVPNLVQPPDQSADFWAKLASDDISFDIPPVEKLLEGIPVDTPLARALSENHKILAEAANSNNADATSLLLMNLGSGGLQHYMAGSDPDNENMLQRLYSFMDADPDAQPTQVIQDDGITRTVKRVPSVDNLGFVEIHTQVGEGMRGHSYYRVLVGSVAVTSQILAEGPQQM